MGAKAGKAENAPFPVLDREHHPGAKVRMQVAPGGPGRKPSSLELVGRVAAPPHLIEELVGADWRIPDLKGANDSLIEALVCERCASRTTALGFPEVSLEE